MHIPIKNIYGAKWDEVYLFVTAINWNHQKILYKKSQSKNQWGWDHIKS